MAIITLPFLLSLTLIKVVLVMLAKAIIKICKFTCLFLDRCFEEEARVELVL